MANLRGIGAAFEGSSPVNSESWLMYCLALSGFLAAKASNVREAAAAAAAAALAEPPSPAAASSSFLTAPAEARSGEGAAGKRLVSSTVILGRPGAPWPSGTKPGSDAAGEGERSDSGNFAHISRFIDSAATVLAGLKVQMIVQGTCSRVGDDLDLEFGLEGSNVTAVLLRQADFFFLSALKGKAREWMDSVEATRDVNGLSPSPPAHQPTGTFSQPAKPAAFF